METAGSQLLHVLHLLLTIGGLRTQARYLRDDVLLLLLQAT
jgi:hypothetical protein